MKGFRIRPRKRPVPGTMGALEERYQEEVLEPQRLAGTVIRYRFEGVKLRLAHNTFYTPDFCVTYEDRMELHETKGFWEEDARAKIKVAATMYPEFVFVAVQYKKPEHLKAVRGAKKEWVFEEIGVK